MRVARLRLGVVVATVLALAALAAPAAYAAREWTGGGSINEVSPDPNWSDNANFISSGSGNELIFPQLSTNAVACSSTKACYESHND